MDSKLHSSKILIFFTKNLNVERGSPLMIFVADCGTLDHVIQINDSHWLRPNESPTNITVLPLIFVRKSSPLNLQKHPRIHFPHIYMYIFFKCTNMVIITFDVTLAHFFKSGLT